MDFDLDKARNITAAMTAAGKGHYSDLGLSE